MKITIVIILIMLGLVLLWIGCGPKAVRGRVVDTVTGEGIGAVTVRAAQRGWGYSSGSLAWDKDYSTTTITDRNGRFTLWYFRGGSTVHLQFSGTGYRSTKEGYPLQDTYIDFWEQPIIKLQRD